MSKLNVFEGKNIVLSGRFYVYYEDMEELESVLIKYGARIKKTLDPETDIFIYSMIYDLDIPVNKAHEIANIHIIDDFELYGILSRLGVKGSRNRKFPDDCPSGWELFFVKHTEELKEKAKTNFMAYPSFESKNFFLHGVLRRSRKIVQYIEHYGGMIQNELSDETDILLCGENFSLDVINTATDMLKRKRIVVLDVALFFDSVEIMQFRKKGDFKEAGGWSTNNFDKVILNELYYAGKVEKRGNISKAIDIYEKILKMVKFHNDSFFRLASIYRENKEYEKELDILDRWYDAVEYARSGWNKAGARENIINRKTKCLALARKSKSIPRKK